jgi:hypothetical protein
MEPLVLVENETTAGGRYDHWQDVTGERYQFPNQYRKKIVPGRRFIYYKGVRRSGGLRATAEYFGHGVIGTVSIDSSTDLNLPKARWKWVCEIVDYWDFPIPVPAKVNGRFWETIPQNFWSVGVRIVSGKVYDDILRYAGLRPQVSSAHSSPPRQVAAVPAAQIQPQLATRPLLMPTADTPGLASIGTTFVGSRRSPYACAVGRRGEEIVLKYLRGVLPPDEAASLRWVSDEGKTPGWDIEYVAGKRKIAVEVKASAGPALPSVEITANEWSAAQRLGANYRLFIVANANGSTPLVEEIRDPAEGVQTSLFEITPTIWRLVRRGLDAGR